MTTLTPSGFTKSTRADRIAQLQGIWASALGTNVDTSPESPDGQIIEALAGMFGELDDVAEAIYTGLLPDGAAGDFLSRLVRLNGIGRNAGAYSTATCTFGGDPGTKIPRSALIRSTAIDDSAITFSPTAQVTIGADRTATGTVICNRPGEISAPAGTLTRIQTVIAGWQTVTNPADATRGYLDEADQRLHARRDRSVATPSQALVDGLLGGLLNLPNVSQAVVWENDQDAPKAMPGGTLAPHSVYAIVDGGDQDEVANAIWLRRSLGCTMMGDVARTVLDSQGHPHTVRFSRPSDVDIWVELDLAKRAGWVEGTEAAIAAAIEAESNKPGAASIGGDSNGTFPWSDILRWIAAEGMTGFSVTAVRIGTSEHPTVPWQNVAISFNAIARFEAAHITVTAT